MRIANCALCRGASAVRNSQSRVRWWATITLLLLASLAGAPAFAQPDTAHRLDGGRFTVVAYPRDLPLARGLLAAAQRRDTFPGLPRPRARVAIAIAPDGRSFRRLVGANTPEWGAAFAFPQSNRIVMQGTRAGSGAGDPFVVLRHELAHLALHERLGDLPPRWFDEGYASWAAGEWGREEYLATNLALLWGGMPSLVELEELFYSGGRDAEAAYALSHRAVADLASLDTARGLTLFFEYWKEEGALDPAVRRAYGTTLSSFEDIWRARTRFRYGGIALFADFGLATLLVLGPFIPLYVARRRRDRAKLEALRAQDEAEDARRREEETLAAILAEDAPPPPPGAPPPPPPPGPPPATPW